MRADQRAPLTDALSALEGIERRLVVYDVDRFLADEDMRLIVERLYITLGEALNAWYHDDPAIVEKIPALPTIIAFRNIIVHRYRSIRPEIVFGLARSDTSALIATLQSMMASLETS